MPFGAKKSFCICGSNSGNVLNHPACRIALRTLRLHSEVARILHLVPSLCGPCRQLCSLRILQHILMGLNSTTFGSRKTERLELDADESRSQEGTAHIPVPKPRNRGRDQRNRLTYSYNRQPTAHSLQPTAYILQSGWSSGRSSASQPPQHRTYQYVLVAKWREKAGPPLCVRASVSMVAKLHGPGQ